MTATPRGSMAKMQCRLKGVVSELLTGNVSRSAYGRRRGARVLRRRSRVFRSAAAIVIVIGLLFLAVKRVEIDSAKRNICAIKAEMRVMEAHVENLESELMLELRSVVVRQRAKERLGMINPSYSELLHLDTRETRGGESTRVASAQ